MRAKQVGILVVLLVAGTAAGAGAAVAYYLNRATAMPTWYNTSTAEETVATSLTQSNRNLLQAKLASGTGVRYEGNNRVAISLSEGEFTQVIAEGLSQNSQTARFLQATEGLQASINGNQVSGGVVVNPAKLPMQELPAPARRALEQAFNTVPMLGDRPLYIGIEGSPRVENGRLILSDDTRVQVGRINLTVADISRLTGISPTQINDRINLALPQTGLTLDGIEFVNGEAVLRGTER
jgi:hypothetical protein